MPIGVYSFLLFIYNSSVFVKKNTPVAAGHTRHEILANKEIRDLQSHSSKPVNDRIILLLLFWAQIIAEGATYFQVTGFSRKVTLK